MRNLLAIPVLLGTVILGCAVSYQPKPNVVATEVVVEQVPEASCMLSLEEARAIPRIVLIGPDGNTRAAGSGFVVAPGWVMTARHVVNKGHKYGVLFEDVQEVTEVHLHPTLDLALVRVDTVGATPLRVSDTDVYYFQRVLATGYPGIMDQITTMGHVQYIKEIGYGLAGEAMATTADAYKGMSGGPVMTCDGRVVGLISAVPSSYLEGFPMQRGPGGTMVRPPQVLLTFMSIAQTRENLVAYLKEMIDGFEEATE